ncbi:MAG: hypothetical protein FJ265_14310 [Planctomycetes bacterium]|nr:hypothetical protein [Planctomycetota bacterium]
MPTLRALCLLFTAGLSAQSLTTSYASNYYLASFDGGVYFDLQVLRELRLDRIDLSLYSPPGTQGTVEVHVRPGGWQGHVGSRGDWVMAASGAVTAAGWQQPSPCTLSQPIGLPAGHFGVALHCRGVMPAYGFAFGLRSFGNGDLLLCAGGSAVQFLESAPFVYRVFHGTLHYTLGGGPFQVATVGRYGEGCRQGARSFYEHFVPGGFDLAGQGVTLVPNGAGGYDVTLRAARLSAPPPGAANLGLARGGATFVALPVPLVFPGGSTGTLRVHSDGRVALTDLGLVGPGPLPASPAELFASQPTLAAACLDLAPAGGDAVFAAFDPGSGATTLWWWNVPTYGDPGSRASFALTLQANGAIEFDYGAMANPNAGCFVGFGAGQGARDPGPRDLSAAAPFATQADDPGLGLAATGRPVLGTATLLRAVDEPAGALGSALLLGWLPLQPGLELTGLGAPGCRLLVEPRDAVWLPLQPGAGLSLPVPNAVQLLGQGCCAQAASWSAVEFVSSHGLVLTFGSV